MNTPVKGQVYNLVTSFRGLKAGQYAVKNVFTDRMFLGEGVQLIQNRVGASTTWSLNFNEFNSLLAKGDLVLTNFEDRSVMEKKGPEKIPVAVGARGMWNRHYNAKRIVIEPCEVVAINPDGCAKVKWLLDDVTCNAYPSLTKHLLGPIDKKWVEKKLKELDAEKLDVQKRFDNLTLLSLEA